MTNSITNPLDGNVVLRGIKIDLNSDVGHGFIVDCCRHIEEIITAEGLRKKYGLNENAWRQLADNEPLQLAIERQRERRVRSGETAREKAQNLFITTPDVLGGILQDVTASPRHRIESAREIRAIAAVGPDAA